MNGQSTVNQPTNNNEQLIGKFHVVNVDKIPVNNYEESAVAATTQQQQQPVAPAAIQQPMTQTPAPAATDESACGSRFQMIRVDRNFGRGRWKVNDYEPPENIPTSINQPVNTIENEPVNISNPAASSTLPASTINNLQTNVPSGLPMDSNPTSSATLAATAASAAAAAATAFQQQQQRLAMNNPAAAVMQTANVPPPAGLLHPFQQPTLPNMAASNQSYILANHPQFGYYPYFPSPYAPYPPQWAALAAAAAAANPFLSTPIPPHQQPTSQLSTGNLGDNIRYTDTGLFDITDVSNENPVMSSIQFSNPSGDHLQNAQLAAATAPFIYTAHHPHPSPYVPQAPPATASPYATIGAYHATPPPPTIIPPSTQPLSLGPMILNNTTDVQQQSQSHQYQTSQQPQQQAPVLTSPKHDTPSTKTPVQPSNVTKTTATAPVNLPKPLTTAANGANSDALRTIATTAAANPTQITDLLLSSSPSISSSHPPPSLLSPITVQTNNSNKTPTTSLNDIWTYAASGSPLNLSQTAAQTAAVTAVAAMGLLTNENSKNTEIANEILKELTTPTKQNNTTDIDNKISAAMDLVKMHLLSAVREEVTELRQQIRILNEKVNSVEHENAFLRQHVPSEIYAQYIPLFVNSSAANDSSNSTTTASTTAPPPVPSSSSQTVPSTTSLSSLPSSIATQPSLLTTSQVPSLPPPLPSAPASINLPPT
ncbi:unnamed protein product [Adineta ricciae]|uniref:Uncharacterized protein n=1 Tax=Adineta ricciae TaxID=249248 RepID=A0A813SC36_ADIRI|nr:unnamed protein product [Adineta ricciae]